MKIEKLHSHPQLERTLGLDENHVIIDKHTFFRLLEQESNQVLSGVKPEIAGIDDRLKKYFDDKIYEYKVEQDYQKDITARKLFVSKEQLINDIKKIFGY